MLASTLFAALAFSLHCGIGAAGNLVSDDRIKVFLFAAPAFWQEVAIDAYKDACVNLDNNLFVYQLISLWHCTHIETG
jgi:hypothetical protein